LFQITGNLPVSLDLFLSLSHPVAVRDTPRSATKLQAQMTHLEGEYYFTKSTAPRGYSDLAYGWEHYNFQSQLAVNEMAEKLRVGRSCFNVSDIVRRKNVFQARALAKAIDLKTSLTVRVLRCVGVALTGRNRLRSWRKHDTNQNKMVESLQRAKNGL
jgi:hypothetical protein